MRNKEYKTNNDVNKNIIRITENELKQIVTESVKKVLTELDWRTYASAGEKAAKQRDNAKDEITRIIRGQQTKAFDDASHEAYIKQYGLEDRANLGYLGNQNLNNASRKELRSLKLRDQDTKNFYDGNSEYKNGKWQTKNPITTECKKKTLKENISANDIFADIKNSIFDLENTGELNVAVLKNNHIVPTKHDYIHAYFKNENELIVEYNGITKSIPCNISKLENNQEYVARCIMQGFAQIYLKK